MVGTLLKTQEPYSDEQDPSPKVRGGLVPRAFDILQPNMKLQVETKGKSHVAFRYSQDYHKNHKMQE